MIETKTYESGLRLVFEHSTSAISALNVLVGVGGKSENYEEEGVSHFLEHLMFKSTKNRTVE